MYRFIGCQKRGGKDRAEREEMGTQATQSCENTYFLLTLACSSHACQRWAKMGVEKHFFVCLSCIGPDRGGGSCFFLSPRLFVDEGCICLLMGWLWTSGDNLKRTHTYPGNSSFYFMEPRLTYLGLVFPISGKKSHQLFRHFILTA